MNLNESLNQMSKSLLDFFFPRHCPFCGRVTGKTLLCEKCEKISNLQNTGILLF